MRVKYFAEQYIMIINVWEIWLRGPDLNQRPSGYEPDELPGCSTPRSTMTGLYISKTIIATGK